MCSVDDPADHHLESGFLVYVMISPPLPSPGRVLRKWLLLLLGMVVNIVLSRVSRVRLFVTLWTLGCYCDAMDCTAARLLCPWDSPGKNTGVGCHTGLQGIFLTQGLNLCLLCLLYWQVGSNGNPLQYSCLENSMEGGAW